MEPTNEWSLIESDPNQSLTVRDLLAIGFRHRRVIVGTFLTAVLVGVVFSLTASLSYRSEMKLLLEKNRLDPAVSAAQTQPFQINTVSEDEINSEVELLTSQDLLQQVVTASHLDAGNIFSISGFFRRHEPAFKTAKAVLQLSKTLDVGPSKKANVITVSYVSGSPQLSYTVVTNLERLYLEKHAKVHHASGAVQFFEQQKQQLWTRLQEANAKLAAFPTLTGTISGETERDVLLQRLGDLKMAQQTSAAEIGQTTERIAMLRKEMANTAPRRTTQLRISDNPNLMQQLKGTLMELELKRSALLTTYQPSYRSVQELDRQIAIARENISAAENAPLRDTTTDNDSAYEWMRLELAKDETELRGLKAAAAVRTASIDEFEANARRLNAAGIEQQELIRQAKDLEESYRLYVQKAEEARIDEGLSRQNILNVSVAEPPTFPVLPQRSRVKFLAMALAVAFVLATGSVVVAECMDKCLHTPYDVQRYLNIPVYAALPAADDEASQRAKPQ
jgi:uncharacterized protein involved in exopolysaccharide biosynthesis